MKSINSTDLNRGYVPVTVRLLDKTRRHLKLHFPQWERQIELARQYTDEGPLHQKTGPVLAELLKVEESMVDTLLRGAVVSDLAQLQTLAIQMLFGTIDPKELGAANPDQESRPVGTNSETDSQASNSGPSEPATKALPPGAASDSANLPTS